jgi:hypothetical protein
VHNHRAKRRDAGATGDEEELGFRRSGRQDERTEWPVDRHARPAAQSAQVTAPSLRLELQQELQMAVRGRLTRRRGNGIGNALRLSGDAQQRRLTSLVAVRTPAERQPDDVRGRRRASDADDLKIARGQNVEMLLLDGGSAVGDSAPA